MARLATIFLGLLFTITLCLCTSCTNVDNQSADKQLTSSPDLDSRLVSIGVTPSLQNDGEKFKFSFHTGTERVPLIGVATPHSLRRAAALYAIQSGEITISVQDVIDNGYWPFDIFPDGFDYSQKISAWDRSIVLSESLVMEIGSDDWVLRCKDIIVQGFYDEYYYFGNLGCPEEATSNVLVIPSQLIPIDEFWMNPVSGIEFAYGEKRGDISEIAMTDHTVGIPCLLSKEDYERSILVLVNTLDLPESPHRLDGKLVSGQYDNWCCFYYVTTISLPETNEYHEQIECLCPGTLDTWTTCDVYWQWTEGGEYRVYNLVRKAACDYYGEEGDPLPEGMQYQYCGGTTNLYWHPCKPASAVNVGYICGECPSVAIPGGPSYILEPEEGDCGALDNILNDINNVDPVLRDELKCVCP